MEAWNPTEVIRGSKKALVKLIKIAATDRQLNPCIELCYAQLNIELSTSSECGILQHFLPSLLLLPPGQQPQPCQVSTSTYDFCPLRQTQVVATTHRVSLSSQVLPTPFSVVPTGFLYPVTG